MNSPPGEKSNTWAGKRTAVKQAGFGFMILFNGRLDAELRGKDPASLGRADAVAAVTAAQREGFPPGAIIFLDQEEGGRLLPEQAAYVFSWVKAIRTSRYKPGVYCSGILVPDGAGRISTAEQILSHEPKLALWVVNDQCPPAPGCAIPAKPSAPGSSGVSQALVWQYARSPKTEFAHGCRAGYARDSQCYVPGLPQGPQTFVDLNLAGSTDPSRGR